MVRASSWSRLRRVRRLALVAAAAALIAVALPASTLAARPVAGSCSGGTIPGGVYRGFTVSGSCTVAFGANLRINGNLVITPGAALDDHGAEAWMHAQVHVTGNVIVGRGAVLGLGWNAPDGVLGLDTVGGNITADRPLALQVGGVTIGGNLVSSGGGVASTSIDDFRNFPIKDNVIHGNLVIDGWHGGWIGVIRNQVDGNAVFVNNVSGSNPETGPGMDPDSSEVQGTAIGPDKFPQTIGGNLICHGNVPAAQVNPLDGGDYNVVGGQKIGECASL